MARDTSVGSSYATGGYLETVLGVMFLFWGFETVLGILYLKQPFILISGITIF